MTTHLVLCPGCGDAEVKTADDYCGDCEEFMRAPEVCDSWADEEYTGGSAYDRHRDSHEQQMETDDAT